MMLVSEADKFSNVPFIRFRIEVSKVMAAAMAECKLERGEIADRMSAILGRKVTKHMLDAYASEARTEHTPAMDVAVAFDMATNSCALSTYLASKMGAKVAAGNDMLYLELGRIAKDRAELAVREAKIRHEAKMGTETMVAQMRLDLMDEDGLAFRMLLAWLVAKHPDNDALNFLRNEARDIRENGRNVFPRLADTLDSIAEDAQKLRDIETKR